MSNRFTVVACAAMLAAGTFVWHADLSAQELDLLGTWLRTSEDGGHQRGVMLFTPTSYVYMVVRGDEPRAEYQGDTMTDDEVVAAYGSFTANAGRYRLEGNQLIREAYMAKDPNYMASWPDNAQTWTVAMDGANRLMTTFEDGVVTTWTRPVTDGVPVR